jgi:hypothetical protein
MTRSTGREMALVLRKGEMNVPISDTGCEPT